MPTRASIATSTLAVLSLLALYLAFNAAQYNEKNLSPQGCEMSWMSPSYVLQTGFNTSWTPLAKRYSLWLYREVGWENESELHGSPVLFIPGNAGSSRQARSIASSAVRQIYTEPYIPSDDFKAGRIAPVDVFTAEFNEDFSALHGPTLLSQKRYVSAAIDYILSLYANHPSPPTQVLLLGHSMGGLVAISVLPSDRVSAVITMSSPNSLPPARFDRRIEDLYHNVLDSLYPKGAQPETPVLALCGGATDSPIPAETCYLPAAPATGTSTQYRKTAFTTSMNGTWTGVGHNEMVWCHQVRSRVARAALELAVESTVRGREQVLDRWFVGSDSPAHASGPVPWRILAPAWTYLEPNPNHHTVSLVIPPSSSNHRISNSDPHLYLLPLKPSEDPHRLVLLMARGYFGEPADTGLQVSLFNCTETACTPLTIPQITPLPLPLASQPFPVPGEGSKPDDYGTATVIENLRSSPTGRNWIGIRVSGRAVEGKRGLIAVLESAYGAIAHRSSEYSGIRYANGYDYFRIAPFFASVSIDLVGPHTTGELRQPLVTDIWGLSSPLNALVVYAAEVRFQGDCRGISQQLIPPLLQHISSTAESHFYPVRPNQRILLHSHVRGPFVPPAPGAEDQLTLRLYSSAESTCTAKSIHITVDWWSTVGRWAMRYWSVVIVWGIGIAAASMALAWLSWERGGPFPLPHQAFAMTASRLSVPAATGILFLSSVPAPRQFLFGTSGEWLLAPGAVLCLVIAAGFVVVIMSVVSLLLWLLHFPAKWTTVQGPAAASPLDRPTTTLFLRKKRNVTAIVAILLLVITFVPHQVAFVITWLMLLWTCASASVTSPPSSSSPSSVPFIQRSHSPTWGARSKSPPAFRSSTTPEFQAPAPSFTDIQLDTYNINRHVLVLQTFLIPLEAPVLAVWIRTLATAGYSAPFDGDHNVFMVAFWLVLVEGLVNGVLWERSKRRSLRLVIPVSLAILAAYTILFGMRYPFSVYELANLVVAYLAASRVFSL